MPRLHPTAFHYLAALLIGLPLTATAGAQDLAGSWRGRWVDTNSGHQGPLQARVTGCGPCYHAVFTGRFFGVVPFRFQTPGISTTETTERV